MKKLKLFTIIFVFSWSLLSTVSHAETMDVKDFSLENYKGKYVYMDFWASWCGPCRASFPWMNQMLEKYSDKGLVIIAVNLDSEKSDAESFLKDYPASFTVVFDPEGGMAAEKNLMGMPSSYFYDTEGKIMFSHVGFNLGDREPLEKKISGILSAQGQ